MEYMIGCKSQSPPKHGIRVAVRGLAEHTPWSLAALV